MGLFGNYLGALMSGVKKPEVPTLEKLDLGKEQQKAIGANIAAIPEAQRLAGMTADESLALMEKVFPGFGAVSSDISKNIGSMTKGEIPGDVRDAIIRSGAGRSLSGGTAGSEFSRNLVARDLGLTSLEIMNRGLSSAESWLAASERLMAPSEAVFTGMFINPMQQANFDVSQNESQWNVNWLRSQIGAMPDPERLALGEFVGGIGDAIASVAIGAYGGDKSIPNAPPPNYGGGPTYSFGGGGNSNWGGMGPAGSSTVGTWDTGGFGGTGMDVFGGSDLFSTPMAGL